MPRPSTLLIDGKPYRWRDIERQRREQLAAWEAERKAAQPELLPGLPERRQPADARTAESRYHAARQASLFPAWIDAPPPPASLRPNARGDTL